MSWLALDTATACASVAVGTTLADAVEESLEGARQHARALIPMVTRVLAGRGLTLDRLEGVLLADGPGSFTGLRVAAAFAKGLADTRGLPLRTAPSLLLRAAAVATDGDCVLATADALRGDQYAGAWRFSGGAVETLLAPTVVRADALASLAGSLDAWLLELLARKGGTVAVTNVQSWEPVYGRPAEAQAKWEREHGRTLPDPAGARGGR